MAESNAAFREAYNKLNAILEAEQAEIIFADEPDKYYIGTKQSGSDVPPGMNFVTGEIEFYCADPFKYAVNEKTVIPTLDDNKTITVDYAGTYKCFPRLEAHAKADLGFVAYINQDEKIIQLGDAEETDLEHYEVSQTLIDESFDTYDASEWTLNNAKTVMVSSEHKQTGTVILAQDANGDTVITGAGYGTGDAWHGPSLTKVVPADVAGKIGAKNCTLSWRHIYTTGTFQDVGVVQFLMTGKDTDGSKKNVAAITFFKNQLGTNQGYAHMYVNGVVKKEIGFDCSWNNPITGYNAGRSSIAKFGSVFTFNVFGKIYEFTVPEMTEVEVTEISIYLGARGTYPKIGMNGVHSIRFVAHKVDAWSNVPNKFCRNDLIVADCKSGEVTVNGIVTPGVGALGNDWESFFLKPGMNQINCVYSSWAVKPEFKLKYREVYL